MILVMISQWQESTDARSHRNLHDQTWFQKKKTNRWRMNNITSWLPWSEKFFLLKYWLRRRHERGPCILQCRLEVSWKWTVIFSTKPANANSCTLQKSAWHPVMSNDDFIIYVSQWWRVDDRMGRRMTAAQVNCNPTYRSRASDLEERQKKEARYHCRGETWHNAAFVGNRLVITLYLYIKHDNWHNRPNTGYGICEISWIKCWGWIQKSHMKSDLGS